MLLVSCAAGATLVVLSLGNLCALDFQVRDAFQNGFFIALGPAVLYCDLLPFEHVPG
jgi:hypothetical protein